MNVVKGYNKVKNKKHARPRVDVSRAAIIPGHES